MASKKIGAASSHLALRNFYHPLFFLQKILRPPPPPKKKKMPLLSCGIHNECTLLHCFHCNAIKMLNT